MKGYVQVYTGDGKGKTTAALGLALRAAGAGLKVYLAQFVKGMEYSELKALRNLSDSIVVKQYGRDCFIRKAPVEEDRRAAQEGLRDVWDVMCSGQYQMIILDEANIATHFNLFPVDDLVDLIHGKPENVEIVITGRRADPRIIEEADLVTEMREIKHYYQKGAQAREGIEK
ncbi:MAG: cob(I)yrinic acid a,c-diamide adenosyltransferase [Syntrophales bacterium]|nr:cob(I)yrinic acid a,c-diamide adenosyltransferase [Syntrophales bacterium]